MNGRAPRNPMPPEAQENEPTAPNAVEFPLSFAQRRLWLLQTSEPDQVHYNMVGAFVLEGYLDADALARAFAADPQILFADEPTGNLDSKTGDAIIDLLLQLARSRNKTLLVVTHDARLAELGDRTLHIVDGVLE